MSGNMLANGNGIFTFTATSGEAAIEMRGVKLASVPLKGRSFTGTGCTFKALGPQVRGPGC